MNAAIVELRRLIEATKGPAVIIVEGNGKYRYPEVNFDIRLNEGVASEGSYYSLAAGSLSNNTDYETLIKSVIRPGIPAVEVSETDLINDEHNWDLSHNLLKLGAFHPCSQLNTSWEVVDLGKGIQGFTKANGNDIILFLKNTGTESAKFKFKNRSIRTNVKALTTGGTMRFKKKLKSTLKPGMWQLYSSVS
jgi:hypothetical protein